MPSRQREAGGPEVVLGKEFFRLEKDQLVLDKTTIDAISAASLAAREAENSLGDVDRRAVRITITIST